MNRSELLDEEIKEELGLNQRRKANNRDSESDQ
jgi:hypothetical protein